MLSVKTAGYHIAQAQHSGGHDLQAIGFKTGVNLADNVLTNSIGLDDGQGRSTAMGDLQSYIYKAVIIRTCGRTFTL